MIASGTERLLHTRSPQVELNLLLRSRSSRYHGYRRQASHREPVLRASNRARIAASLRVRGRSSRAGASCPGDNVIIAEAAEAAEPAEPAEPAQTQPSRS